MITKEELQDFGLEIDVENFIFPMKKVLADGDDENDLGELMIAVCQMRNVSELCLVLPDGSIVYLGGIETIEELKVLEKSITEWESNY